MIKYTFWVVIFLFHIPASFAGIIRTIKVNDTQMKQINLKMGKASVLRFSEKPKKVVIGNQNYFAIEFIDNDLTIQPLGDVETNVFVYTSYRTYGFILRVCRSCTYDDLVYVKWKSKHKPRKNRKVVSNSMPGFKSINITFAVFKTLSITALKTMVDYNRSLRYIDLLIENKSKSKVDLSRLQIIATRGGNPLKQQGYIIEKDVLKVEEKSKARLFLSSKVVRGFSLNILMDNKRSKVIVGRKYLK